MKNGLYLLLIVCFFIFNPFAGVGEEDNGVNYEQFGGWSDGGTEGFSFDSQQESASMTKEARRRMEKEAERMAYKIVEYKFKEIDRKRKLKEKEEKRRAKEKEKEERKKQIEKEEAEGKRVKDKWQLYLEELGLKNTGFDEVDIDESDDYEYYKEEFELSGIDTVLLHQKMVEVEREMLNTREIEDAKRSRRKDGIILLRIKIPPCRYLNEVIYKREKFEFVYQLEFFNYYFERRYFHKRQFYDKDDPTRVIAKHVLKLLGNTTHRKTDFNAIIDSVEILVGYSVDKYLDQVISDINLEYLATGTIKIIYKGKLQRRIYSRVKPSNIEKRSLGNIRFYSWDKKTLVEQIDASLYDASLPEPEDPDSIYRLIHPPPPDTTAKKVAAKDSTKKYKYAFLKLFGRKKQAQSDSTSVDSLKKVHEEIGFLRRFFKKLKSLFVKEKPAQFDSGSPESPQKIPQESPTESPPVNPTESPLVNPTESPPDSEINLHMDSAMDSPPPEKEKKISRKKRKNVSDE